MNHNHEEKLTAYALGELEGIDVEDIEALIENDEEARRYVEDIRAIGSVAEEAFATESLGHDRHEAILEKVGVDSESRNRFTISGTPLGWKRWSALAACVVAVLAGLVGLNAPNLKTNPSLDEQGSQLASAGVSVAPDYFVAPEKADEEQIVRGSNDVEVYQSVVSDSAANWEDSAKSLGIVDNLMREGQAGLDETDATELPLVINNRSRLFGHVTDEDVSEMSRSQVEFIRTGIEQDKLMPESVDGKGDRVSSSDAGGKPSNLQNVQVGGEIRIRGNFFAGGDLGGRGGRGGGQAGDQSNRFDINGDGVDEPIPGYTQPDTIFNAPRRARGGQGAVSSGVAENGDKLKALGYLSATGGLDDQSGGGVSGGGGRGGGGGGADQITGYYFNGRRRQAANLNTEEIKALESLGYTQIARVDYFNVVPQQQPPQPEPNTEAYDRITDNPFKRVVDEPLSTFSIDVDTGSYANVRRFLRDNQLPPKDAVRIEELLNYFAYTYTPPANDDPFAAHVELVECPWNVEHQLMRIGLKGREVEVHTRPAANLVFLLDVSGSMSPDNKLPLVRNAMKLLTKQLRPDDRVAIVTYAGASGLALPSTPGTDQATILSAIGRLNSGGSTNGAAGIELAYQVAQENFFDGGVNRVILATDGDFNVGTTDRGSLDRLIEQKAKSGVFLTVLGVGEGNLKDATMEQLADKGNGQYAYLDSDREARKVLVDQVGGTLVTIAKDVKIQIDFNPAKVGAYRLIGYENRVLAAQDFDDDTKDAGEIGAGHNVTALYEIVPPGTPIDAPSGTQSRYQVAATPNVDTQSNELLTVKLRHKAPDSDTSELLEIPITAETKRIADASRDTRFAASVAAFGMALRESPYRGTTDWDLIAGLAEDGLGKDPHGYRAEFLNMIQIARQLKPAIALPQQTAATDSSAFDLIRIMPWTGGTYVAEIRTQAEEAKAKRYGVGDSFGSYRIISIDPSGVEVAVYSEEHRREIKLHVTKEFEAHSRAESHYLRGIEEYQHGAYRDALNNFSRAIVLDPTMEKARDMIKKSENKITFKGFVR